MFKYYRARQISKALLSDSSNENDLIKGKYDKLVSKIGRKSEQEKLSNLIGLPLHKSKVTDQLLKGLISHRKHKHTEEFPTEAMNNNAV